MSKMLVVNSTRDQEWLEIQLATIWYKYFSDVEQKNKVQIRYGRKAKRRLGSIGLDPLDRHSSIISINPIYQDEHVPEYVVYATIIHEMIHYAHGFNSPHTQKQRHPHSGGVIRKEFAQRGLEDIYLKQDSWLKANWPSIITKYFDSNPKYLRQNTSIAKKSSLQAPWWIRIR